MYTLLSSSSSYSPSPSSVVPALLSSTFFSLLMYTNINHNNNGYRQ